MIEINKTFQDYLFKIAFKNLMTEHEDVEVGRCIWTHLDIDCTKSYETNAILVVYKGPLW